MLVNCYNSETTLLRNVYNHQYSDDLSEKCRKALEFRFGEIPMPKCFDKRSLLLRLNLLIRESHKKIRQLKKEELLLN